jgi:peroxiredoxin
MEGVLLLSSVLLWVVLLLNLGLTLALVRRVILGGKDSDPMLKAGTHAPAFSAETLRGETVTKASYAGRSVALIFVAPHCESCRTQIPLLETLRPRAARDGVDLVLVSVASGEATQAYADELKITLPILVAPSSNPFRKDYHIPGTPAFCLIDPHGNIASTGLSHPEDKGWAALIDAWSGDALRPAHLVPMVGG